MNKIPQAMLHVLISQFAIISECQQRLMNEQGDQEQVKQDLGRTIDDLHKLTQSVLVIGKLTGTDEVMKSCLQKIELEMMR